MTKRKLLAAVVLLAVALAASLVLAPRHDDFHLRAKAEQIKEGMTSAEVRAIVGRAPGEYARDGGYVLWLSDDHLRPMEAWAGFYQEVWTADDGELVVVFGPGETVARAQFSGYVYPAPSVWDRFRGVLPW